MSYYPKVGHGYGNQNRRSSGQRQYSKGNRLGNNCLNEGYHAPKIPSTYERGVAIASKTLMPILRCVEPTTNLIYTGYNIADTLYENREAIQHLIKGIEEGNTAMVASTALSLTGDIVSDTFSDIAWSAIETCFPVINKDEVEKLFKSTFSNLTAAELQYVSEYIEKHGRAN